MIVAKRDAPSSIRLMLELGLMLELQFFADSGDSAANSVNSGCNEEVWRAEIEGKGLLPAEIRLVLDLGLAIGLQYAIVSGVSSAKPLT